MKIKRNKSKKNWFKVKSQGNQNIYNKLFYLNLQLTLEIKVN